MVRHETPPIYVQGLLCLLAVSAGTNGASLGFVNYSHRIKESSPNVKWCRVARREGRLLRNFASMTGGDGVVTAGRKVMVVALLGLQLFGAPCAQAARKTDSQESLDAQRSMAFASTSSSEGESEMIKEVEEFELQTEVEGELKSNSKLKPGPTPPEFTVKQTRRKKAPEQMEPKRMELVDILPAKLTKSVESIQGLSPYLDDVEYLITKRSWDYLKGFLGVFNAREADFVALIDGMYPTQTAVDTSSRDSMQIEAENIFLAVDDLYQAAMSKKVKAAEKSYVKLALAYDRFLKAGNLISRYDPVSSTEKFFRTISDDMLVYDRDSKAPLEVRDEVLILKGPDMGRTGRVIGIIQSRKEGIVRLDGTGTREVRIVELEDIARQKQDPVEKKK